MCLPSAQGINTKAVSVTLSAPSLPPCRTRFTPKLALLWRSCALLLILGWAWQLPPPALPRATGSSYSPKSPTSTSLLRLFSATIHTNRDPKYQDLALHHRRRDIRHPGDTVVCLLPQHASHKSNTCASPPRILPRRAFYRSATPPPELFPHDPRRNGMGPPEPPSPSTKQLFVENFAQ